MLETLGEEWKKQWVSKGRAEGRAHLLMGLLEQRFGPLSDDQRARILSADETTVSVWAKRLLEADTLDEVLSQPH